MRAFFTDQTLGYLVYLGMMLGIFLAFTAITSFLSGRESRKEARSRRLRLIRDGHSLEERLAILKPPSRASGVSKVPFFGSLPTQLRQGGVELRSGTFILACCALALGSFVVLVTRLPVVLSVLIALVIGFALPFAALHVRVARQTEKMILQLPDALDLMARGLKVGHPLNTSIGAVAREMPDPIGREFGIVYDQVSYGDDLPEAFQDMAERVEIEDVYYLSASIGIQHGSGGDLARVIEVLSKVIRNRISMRRKIRAISSEGRASALFLSVLPFAMFTFTSISAPDYYGGVRDDPLFIPLAVTVLGLVAANLLILRKLVNFHV
ncbi:type II secretion system F family protein [Pseudothioclava nitratireducens]|jgi:tight adherence protein B|uniref:type II secretion system F family protein n=1 Tax=Pseudothioclava nitratireducens TaxID=1928646 RepID=UPI0023DBAA1A|nr:type II secretion system F family protein [Defluviimonas nitratireducens]MDF1619639.1 type II secretion system F family protein [Defluviimonas nitratireducens]